MLEIIGYGLVCCAIGAAGLMVYCILTAGKRADELHTPPKMDK